MLCFGVFLFFIFSVFRFYPNLVCPEFPGSLDSLFLNGPSVFSNVYFNGGVYNRLLKMIDIIHATSLMLTISIHLHNVLVVTENL